MPTVTYQVSAGADDAFRYSTSGFSAAGSQLSIGLYGGTGYSTVLRFLGIGIPLGSTITAAYLQFLASDNAAVTPCAVRISAEDVINSTQATSAADFDSRVTTSAYTDWTVPAFTLGTWYSSADISASIQAVINKSGWASGNALSVFVKENGSGADAYRNFKTFESGSANAAKLVITYTPPTVITKSITANVHAAASVSRVAAHAYSKVLSAISKAGAAVAHAMTHIYDKTLSAGARAAATITHAQVDPRSIREIDTAIRFRTTVGDATKHCTQIAMSSGGTIYTQSVTPNDGSAMMLADNPLIRGESDTVKNAVLANIAASVSAMTYRPSDFDFFGDPALEPGDVVTLTGGVADEGVSTAVLHNIWRYRGNHQIMAPGNEESGVTQDQVTKLTMIKADVAYVDELHAQLVESALFKGTKLELGGLNNGNGEFEIQDEAGNVVATGNKSGIAVRLPARSAGSLSVPFAIYDDQFSKALLSCLALFESGGPLQAAWYLEGNVFKITGSNGRDITFDPVNKQIGFSSAWLGADAAGTGLLFNGEKVWNAGNDGPGSGLDADTLDTLHGSAYPVVIRRAKNGGFDYVSNQETVPFWGYITGAGTGTAQTYTLNFGVTFDDYPVVVVTANGSTTSIPTGPESFTNLGDFRASVGAIGHSSCTLRLQGPSTLAAGTYYGFTAIVMGTKSR